MRRPQQYVAKEEVAIRLNSCCLKRVALLGRQGGLVCSCWVRKTGRQGRCPRAPSISSRGGLHLVKKLSSFELWIFVQSLKLKQKCL